MKIRSLLNIFASLMLICFTSMAFASEPYRVGRLFEMKKVGDNYKFCVLRADDVHRGNTVGYFYVDNYTKVILDEPIADPSLSNPSDRIQTYTILKNYGDKIALKYKKTSHIDAVGGFKDVWVCPYSDGCGHGYLKILFKDHTGSVKDEQYFYDFLAGEGFSEAGKTVYLCEEGDYDAKVEYLLEHEGMIYNDTFRYVYHVKFQVRNGNCIIFPRDLKTNGELLNGGYTENGFKADFAGARYLDVNVKCTVFNEGVDGTVEDVRFNRPCKDGENFTEEGIYTITVSNRYTKETIEKKIYVGSNPLIKAHMSSGLPISRIRQLVKEGVVSISPDGTLIETKQPNAEEKKPEDTKL